MTDEQSAKNSPEVSDPDSELRPEPLLPDAPHKSPAQAARDFFKKPPDPPIQFSLGEFLIWIAIMSVGLSALSWIQPHVFAGVCGALAVVVLVFCPVERPQSKSQLVFTALLAMYAITFVIALVRHGR